MSDKPMTSEASVEANSDKMPLRAAELGIPYDAARAIYSEAFHDGFGNYAALKAELEQWKVDCGREFEARIKAQAENERLIEQREKWFYEAKLLHENEGRWLTYQVKAEAELSELRAFKERWGKVAEAAEHPDLMMEYCPDNSDALMGLLRAALAAKEPGKEPK